MKQLGWLSSVGITLWLCGCASSGWSDARWGFDPGGPRFREEGATDVVVRFLSWDSITITKPDTREGGFLPTYKREQAERVLRRLEIEHRLAVVVCSRTLSREQQATLQAGWRSIFSGLGFERVVFLRARDNLSVNGCSILDDLHLKPGFAAATPKLSNP